jgi:hypothetical protein
MTDAIRALGRQMSGGAIATFIVSGFLVGIFAVWLYVAIRPVLAPASKLPFVPVRPPGVGHLLASVTPIVLNLFPIVSWSSALWLG